MTDIVNNRLAAHRLRKMKNVVEAGKDLLQHETIDGWTSSELFGCVESFELAQLLIDARYAMDALIAIERSLANELITRYREGPNGKGV